MIEIWKPITYGEGKYADFYHVSNLGQVKSLARSYEMGHNHHGTLNKIESILKPIVVGENCSRVTLHCGPGSARRNNENHYIVARVVGHEFIGPIPSKFIAYHIDGDRTNDRADNLTYVPRSLLLALNALNGPKPRKNVDVMKWLREQIDQYNYRG